MAHLFFYERDEGLGMKFGCFSGNRKPRNENIFFSYQLDD